MGVEPPTFRSEVQHANHYITAPLQQMVHKDYETTNALFVYFSFFFLVCFFPRLSFFSWGCVSCQVEGFVSLVENGIPRILPRFITVLAYLSHLKQAQKRKS